MASNVNASTAAAGCCILGTACVAGTALSAGVGAALGYLGASVFTTINPATGALFGAVYGVVNGVAQNVFACNGLQRDCCSFIVASVVSALSAKLILEAAFGVALTTEAALILAAASIGAGLITSAAICCCCGAAVLGAAAAAS